MQSSILWQIFLLSAILFWVNNWTWSISNVNNTFLFDKKDKQFRSWHRRKANIFAANMISSKVVNANFIYQLAKSNEKQILQTMETLQQFMQAFLRNRISKAEMN